MTEQPLSPSNPAVGARQPSGYTPLVPTFSPYTTDPQAAVRLAWRVTVGACLALVALLVGGPLARNWYVGAAVEPRAAKMMPIDGVVFVRRQGTGDWLAARPDEQIAPGDLVRTAENARAFVTLFDQSTVLLYPSSTLRVLRAEQGRFRDEKRAVVLELSQGRARVGVAPPPDPAAAFFQLRTPHAEIHIQEGSYSADVAHSGTQVRVRLGDATAHTAQGSASATIGQRLLVQPERQPVGGLPARRDLVENGYFNDAAGGLPAGWTVRAFSEQDPGGVVSLDERAGAVSFRRDGRGHGETLITQTLDVDLWDFEQVTLSASLRVLEHGLSGGGWEGTEFPLMLRVFYRDGTGGVIPWYQGYYLHNRENFPVRHGEALPSTEWHRVEIDLLALAPRPWRIQRVEVVAQGWDYASAIREFHIWAE
ncbi:MAG: FecR domain-containing protein [Chloroflexota bacterium]